MFESKGTEEVKEGNITVGRERDTKRGGEGREGEAKRERGER